MELAYNLYLLEHNAELRSVLVGRLKDRGQFLGALSEIRAAGMLVRAGFAVKFHDESDSTRTHCEYDVTRSATGKHFSVEVKTRHWENYPENDAEGRRQVQIHIGRLLRLALAKEAAHDRIVFIEFAMPDEMPAGVNPGEPWWMQAAIDGVRDTERLLKDQGKEVPAARVILANHPYHFHLDSTHSLIGLALEGLGPTDLGNGKAGSIREARRLRQKHGDLLALWKSIEKHRDIPQTFDGQSHHLAFGDHPARLIVGQRYVVPDARGVNVEATLEDAVVLPSEGLAYGIYKTDAGERVICTNPPTDAESKAFAEEPDTFFGVVNKQTSTNDPLELFDFFFESYGTASREVLLGLMNSCAETLTALSREELAELYCEGLVYTAMQMGSKAEPPGTASNSHAG